MIGFLRGVLIEKTPDALLLDAGGVGYEVVVPASSLCALPPEGSPAQLYIHTHVREEAIRLFGFASLFDRKVFEALLSVTNVGPRLAVALLGPLDGVELCETVVEGRVALLVSIPGVGAKTAERLILELKPKFAKLLHLRALYSGAKAVGWDDPGMARAGARRAEDASCDAATGSLSVAQGDGFSGAGAVAKLESPADEGSTLFPTVGEGDGTVRPDGTTKGARAGKALREAKALEERLQARRAMEDARSALENIGYKEKQIEGVLKDIQARTQSGEPVVVEVVLRDALRQLSGHLFKEKEGE
jgi:Holliday junction DNA helicase RuvA subunit